MILYLSAAAAIVATATPALAASPLTVTAVVLSEARTTAPDGTTAVRLVPVSRVTPGDGIVYALNYHNGGGAPVRDVVLDNPVPKGVAYRAPADGSPAPEVSVDGRQFAPLSALRVTGADGRTRPALAEDVTHVRWRLPNALAPGATGRVAFRAVLK